MAARQISPEGKVPLIVLAQALGLTYRQALDAALIGKISAERINGRWWVSEGALQRAQDDRDASTPR